jgi:glucose/arabinose dehydrogenase/type 1 glutamine amidotransferase
MVKDDYTQRGDGSGTSDRRRFLKGVGALGMAGAAGCLGGGDDDTDTSSTDTPTGSDTDTPSGGNGNGSTDTPTPDPQVDISITETTIRGDTVQFGESMEVEVVLSNAGDADGIADLSLGVDATTVAEDGVNVPAGEEVTHVFTHELSASGTFTITLNGDEIGDVTVEAPGTFSLLVLSITKGFRHTSAIDAGNPALESVIADIGDDIGADMSVEVIDNEGEYAVDGFQDAIPSTADAFQEYDAVVFHNTTGSVLNETQKSAFREYVETGGGYVGIHAGADTHKGWQWYDEELVGATFVSHPSPQEAEIHVTDRTHPSTMHLDARWVREEEWYDFNRNPRGSTHVLATVDERTYSGAGMDGQQGRDHPIAWCSNVGQGRSFYSGFGHKGAYYEEADFLEHLKGGLMWAAGYVEGDATGTVWDAYSEETVAQAGTGRYDAPMKMDVSADNRLFYTELGGSLNVVDIDTGTETEILSLDVYTGEEDGLQGVALDPDFPDNGYVYLYHAPTDVPDIETGVNHFGSEMGVNRISRFTVDGDSVDPATEEQILDVVTQRHTCCHAGGDLEFDTNGNLYLTTGDDTNPFESSGFTPIDERDGREPWDAQRSSANTDDLRGSVVRINPNEDGSYDIPDGNLRSVSDGPEENVRPELYAIGMRNPFTAAVDPETDTLFLADYGPDSRNWNADRGPYGSVEYAKVDEPGFYGWPYFTGHSVPYREYEFDTDSSGDIFDPGNPTNDSVNNSGLENLPAAEGTMIMSPFNWADYLDYPSGWDEYVPYSSIEEVPFPQVSGGAPMIGTVFRDSEDHGDSALSGAYDGKVFMMEYTGNWVKYATLDDAGEAMEVDPFAPDRGFSSPFDMAVGPDGSLYLMERGNGTITRFTVDPSAITGDLSMSLSGIGGRAAPGSSATLTATLTNTASVDIENVEASLEVSGDDLDISEGTRTSPGAIEAGTSTSAEWDVGVPGSASGSYDLTVTVTYTLDDENREIVETSSFLTTDGVSGTYGLNCGGTETSGTVEIDGLEFDNEPGPNVTVTDGTAFATGSQEIENTDHDLLYRSELFGANIGFDIAVENGIYNVVLHFAEIYQGGDGNGGGEGSRVFDVSVQGETVLEGFDIYAEVGHDVAVTKVVSDVEVDDGSLVINGSAQADNAKFSGIEIRES